MGSSPPICLSVGNGDQASGRVDVPDGDFLELDHKFQMSAGAFAAAAKKHGIGRFQRVVIDNHSEIRIFNPGSCTTSLCSTLESLHICSTWFGKEGFLLAPGPSPVLVFLPVPTSTCARLLGSGRVPIEGEWVCLKCGMQGCWPTRHPCFRCVNPRNPRNGGQVETARSAKGTERVRTTQSNPHEGWTHVSGRRAKARLRPSLHPLRTEKVTT